MSSDALPPARNYAIPNSRRAVAVCSLLLLVMSLPWFTGCTAASSAMSGNSQITNPRTPANRNANSFLKITGNLPAGVIGTPYNAAIDVSGGKAAYDFNLSWGSLPPGLSLNSGMGTISGVPSKSGVYQFGVHVVDSTGRGGADPFQITISDSSAVSVVVSPATGTIASAGTQQFTATVSNTSNVGVTWTASAGTISSSGLYQAPSVSANTQVTIKATSTADSTKSGSASFTITAPVQSALTITTTGLTNVTSGVSYSATLKATGGKSPYSWSLISGSLPSGMSVKSSGNLSGTTTQTGQFSFTVQVSDSSSPQQVATQALALIVSTANSGGNTIPLAFFGADFNSGKTWGPTDGNDQPASLGGVRLWDDGVKWGQLNTSNGVYNWTGLDNWLGKAQSEGMDVLYTFGDTPQFVAAPTAPAGCLSPGLYSCAPPIDVNSDGTGTDAYFQAFVTALVTHAAGRIAYYELWNEPDCSCFWSGTQAQLVRMGKDAAAIIRSLDPNAKILSPSAHGPTMATWFDGYVAAGGAPNFDIVNVHMRGENGTNGSPEAFLTVYGQVIAETQKRNLTSLPLWDDEHGILAGQGVSDPDELAGYVARSILLRAGVALQRQYIYTWDTPSTKYALQGNESGTAWDQVAGWLIGHTISACTANGTVYTCALDNGLAVWDTSQSCSNGVCTSSNYNYPASYIWYHDLDGNRVALSGKSVGIGYKPILLSNE